jgi:putative DNA primase/helicase
MTDAEGIGSALRGRTGYRTRSGFVVPCPCLGHGKGRGDRNPSLSIGDGKDGRLLLKCFGGCSFEDILDELKARGLVGDKPPGERPRRDRPVIRPPAPPDDYLLELLASCVSPLHTPAEEYLARRGLVPPLPSSIRYTEHGNRPAMVAVVQDLAGNEVALQRTFITRDGEKAEVTPVKRTTGAMGYGAVRLAPAGKTLGLAEGVEDALSVIAMTGIPCWATLGGQRLQRIELPDTVREVVLFADSDDAGIRDATFAADVYRSTGRTASIQLPPGGQKDFNEVILNDANNWQYDHG